MGPIPGSTRPDHQIISELNSDAVSCLGQSFKSQAVYLAGSIEWHLMQVLDFIRRLIPDAITGEANQFRPCGWLVYIFFDVSHRLVRSHRASGHVCQ